MTHTRWLASKSSDPDEMDTEFAKIRTLSFVGSWFGASLSVRVPASAPVPAESTASIMNVIAAQAFTSRKSFRLVLPQSLHERTAASSSRGRCCMGSGTAAASQDVDWVEIPWRAVSGVEFTVLPAPAPGPHCPCLSVTMEVNLAAVTTSPSHACTEEQADPHLSKPPVGTPRSVHSSSSCSHVAKLRSPGKLVSTPDSSRPARYGLLAFTAFLHELEHVRFFGHVAHTCWAAHATARVTGTAGHGGVGTTGTARAASGAAGDSAAMTPSAAEASSGAPAAASSHAAVLPGEGADFGLSNAYIHHLQFWPAAFRALYSPRLRRVLQRGLPLVFLFLSICSLVSALRTLYIEVPALQQALDASVDRAAAALGPVSELISDAAARAQTLIASLALAGFVQRAVKLVSLWISAMAAAARGICAPAIAAARILAAVLSFVLSLLTSAGGRLLASLGALLRCGAIRKSAAAFPAALSAASCRNPLLCCRAAANCCCQPVRVDARRTALRNFIAWLFCESRARARAAAEQLAAASLQARLVRESEGKAHAPQSSHSESDAQHQGGAIDVKPASAQITRRQASVWLDRLPLAVASDVSPMTDSPSLVSTVARGVRKRRTSTT